MPISLKPLQPFIGAEVLDFSLADATVEELNELRAALLAHKVLFLRGQAFDRARHVAIGRVFGELETHPLSAHPEHPEILQIKSKDGIVSHKRETAADFWHSDTTFRERPSAISILKAYQLPGIGGDTLWANMAAVYEGLSGDVRKTIDQLDAYHDGLKLFSWYLDTADKQNAFRSSYPVQRHPVVRVHPETGEKLLFVNSAFTTSLVGLDAAESNELLRHLNDEVKRPEYQVRFRWEPGSVAIWDNRSTQHYGVVDYSEPRHLERVTVIGEKPFGRSALD